MLTLIEAAKQTTNPLQRAVVEFYARNSAILERLPFKDISGNAYTYNLEETLPGIAFRGVNETYTESTGTVNPQTETLKIMGGQAKVDRFLEKTQGNGKSLMGEQVEKKSKAAALFFTREFLKGSATVNPLGFDGLELRLTGSQVIDCGSTVGGDALTLDKLDELLDGVQGGADVLYMNKTMRRKVNKLMRSAGQAMEMVSDSFGRPIYAYAGVPIGIIDVDNAYDPILAFDEDDCTDAEGACTSVYAVRFGVDGVCGLQAGPLQVLPLADENVWKKVDIEWYCTPAIFHPRAAARLRGIKNA